MERIARFCAPALGLALLCLLTLSAAGCAGGVTESSNNATNDGQSGVSSPQSAAPIISGFPPTTAMVGSLYTFQPSAYDTEGGALTFSIANKPQWASFDPTSGKLTGTPSSSDTGMSAAITISVSDGGLSAELSPFQIDVQTTATSPGPLTISGTPPTAVAAGAHYAFQPSVSGPNGATLTFSITNLPSWAAFSAATGQLSGTPASSVVGTYSDLTITVSDGVTTAALAPFSIQVTAASNPPAPPTISGTPATQVQAGQSYAFTPAARDASGAALTFSIQNKPAWASFSTGTGELLGTPATAAAGTYAGIIISVSDGDASAALPAFAIKVTAATVTPPTPPTISGSPGTQVQAAQHYSFTPVAQDANGLPLTFSIVNRPTWATFDGTTGQLAGTPTAANVGTSSGIVISVSDGEASAALPAFAIKVTAAPPPTISGTPVTHVQAGKTYAFTPGAAGPNGMSLAFSIQNKPTWANFSGATGELSGTPSSGSVGTTPNIVISVSDGESSASLTPFSLQVTADPPPSIGGTPATQVQAGQNYAFTPTASDADGAPLTFSIQNKPAWATFSATTGELSGTPANGAVGTYSNILISVSNGESSASLSAFAIQVTAAVSNPPPPVPPTISGSPPTQVQAGQSYAFTPTASGPAGSTLSFSVQNLPSWASFNATNGQLSGTPTAGNVGSYPGIVMSVSDGSASASLPAFAITVTAAAAANPTVSLSASPASISSGSSATLNWSSANATSCSASGGWSGTMATSGNMSTGALSSSTTYTLTCSGAGGTTPASASTTVSVQSGTTGGVSRPSYNTGYGLFVLNGKLYDSKGIEFRIRGVNLCHYDSTQYSGPGIARSNANTVRVGLYLSSISTSTYVNTLQTYISDSENVVATMFYVPGTRNVTSGDQSTADLASVVQNWVTNYQYYAPLQQHLIIDVANEWGPQDSATWESAYISAIASLRAAGYTAPIMIDTGAWGQDTGDLLNYAQAVFNSDPQKNVIFSLHVYAGLGDGWSVASLNAYALQLQSLAASAGMVFVFGEFGPGADIGPSPTMLTPQQVIGAAEAAGIGWMGWAWDDNNLSDGAASNSSFSMTFNGPGIYTVPSDLTTYGQEMVLSNYALALAKKATDF
jgi:hypothetical protein